MWEIRAFEEATQRLFTSGLVRGSTHLCQGQEAVVVGACGALRDGDSMLCTYRGHGAVLAMGAPLAGGWASTLVTRVVTAGALLAAPPSVVASQETPVPYATNLETAWLPSVERIVDAASRPAEVA
jgi:hypothetical protein